jgi:hypothetical protein
VDKSSIYRQKVRKVFSDVKRRNIEVRMKSSIYKNMVWKVISEVKGIEVG